MVEALRYLGQAAVYLAIAAVLGYLSNAPSYTRFPPDKALIKISFAHGAAPKGECRRLTPEEIAELPPNMRRPVQCPRERLPVLLELRLDERILFREALPPTGWSKDGPSRVYQRFAVAPGRHRLVVRMRDTDRAEGFDHQSEQEVVLDAGESLAIDFKPEAGGFVFM